MSDFTMDILWFLTLPIFCYINLIRAGGVQLINKLPIRPLIWASLLVGIVTFPFMSWELSLATALGFLIWGLPGHGLWFDLGRANNEEGELNDPRWNGPYVKVIWAISFKNDHIALFLRHLIGVAPYLAFLSVWLSTAFPVALSIPFALLVVLIFELGYRTGLTKYREQAVGGLWWVLITLGVFL